jgi:hypothetical protein
MTTSSKTKKTFTPVITVDGSKKIGATAASLETLISELIDNPIPQNKPVKPIFAEVFIVNRDGDSTITIVDNSIGIPNESIESIFTYGKSGNEGKLLLSKMGMGMKIAIGALGDLDYILTKVKGKPVYKIGVVPYASGSDKLTYYVEEYDGKDFIYESGTKIVIKNCEKMLRKWTKEDDFIRFCNKIEATYPDLLGTYLNVRIVYAGKNTWQHDCQAYKPLMSCATKIINISTALGANLPELNRFLLDVPEHPEVRAFLTAFYKPTPEQVGVQYKMSGDETYNPEKYRMSPWFYGAERSGISLKYRGKILEHNLLKESSRSEKHGIILEIEEGMDYTALKSGTQKTARWAAIINSARSKLEEINFYVRSRAGLPSLSEDTYLDKFLDKLRNNPTFKKAYDITDPEKQVLRKPRCDVGAPDGLIVSATDTSKVLYVIEAKKDLGGGEECRQLVGYMAHYNCSSGIFVSPTNEASFWKQLDDFNRNFGLNYKVKQADITYVNALEFFEAA